MARMSLAEVQNVKVSGDVKTSVVYRENVVIGPDLNYVLSDSSLDWTGSSGLGWYNLSGRTKTGTPDTFKVTVERFRVSSDSGTTWTTINDGSVEFDIASVNTNSAVANYSAGNIALGTYNSIEYTISATCRVQGYILDAVGATDYYTSTTESNGTNSTTSFDINNPPSDYGEAALTILGCSEGDSFAVTHTVELIIEKGVNRKLNIDFDVADNLELYSGEGSYRLRPAAPTVTVSLE